MLCFSEPIKFKNEEIERLLLRTTNPAAIRNARSCEGNRMLQNNTIELPVKPLAIIADSRVKKASHFGISGFKRPHIGITMQAPTKLAKVTTQASRRA
jgi:hypothetical protein